MATVTVYNATRMKQIEDTTVVSGSVSGMGNLILHTRAGVDIDAGTIVPASDATKYYRGDKSWQTLDKNAVGLGNVDNTSDANKPASTPQKAAFLMRWITGVTYAVGNQVVAPNNTVVTANVAHTAGATFAGDIAKWNVGPEAQGRILRRTVAVSSGNIGATETIVYNIPTFTFKAGRKYKIEWDTDWLGSAVNTAADFTISTCAVADAAGLTTGLTKIGLRTGQAPLANISANMHVTALYEPTVDTTVQLKFSAQLVNASTFIVQGNRAGKVEYTITDEGAQY